MMLPPVAPMMPPAVPVPVVPIPPPAPPVRLRGGTSEEQAPRRRPTIARETWILAFIPQAHALSGRFPSPDPARSPFSPAISAERKGRKPGAPEGERARGVLIDDPGRRRWTHRHVDQA